jgi:hypothetical protein
VAHNSHGCVLGGVHAGAMLFRSPPGVPQILGCIEARGYQEVDEASAPGGEEISAVTAAFAHIDVQ